MICCSQGISKTIMARNFKVGQLIEDDEKITWQFIFNDLMPFANVQLHSDILVYYLPFWRSFLAYHSQM